MTPTVPFLVSYEAQRAAQRIRVSHADIDDFAQVARIAAWQAEQAFDGRGSFVGFVQSRIRRALIDEGRNLTRTRRVARSRRHERSFPEVVILPLEQDVVATVPAMVDPFLVRRLRAAVATLPVRWRQMLTAYFYEDREQGEIGVAHGVTQGRVSHVISQAIGQLRVEMGVAA